jgi:hypothetical protein
VRYRLFTPCFILAMTSALMSGPAAAQFLPPLVEQPTTILQPPLGYPPTTATSAAGPYFATPSWDQKLAPNVRFVILTNFGNDAALDRETGLVWARQPTTSSMISWFEASLASTSCRYLSIGDRGGWRLPTPEELLTLIDHAIPLSPSTLRVPVGHPFVLPTEASYWTSESFDEPVVQEHYAWKVSLRAGVALVGLADQPGGLALCVRGRQ